MSVHFKIAELNEYNFSLTNIYKYLRDLYLYFLLQKRILEFLRHYKFVC